MIDEVVFVRHGRTDYNLARRLQGQIDIPLDAVGRWQADMMAYELAHRYYWAKAAALSRGVGSSSVAEGSDPGDGSSCYRDLPVHSRALRIVSSDLMRARQTAEALGTLLHVGVEVDARLRERSFGSWEGMTREEIKAMDLDAYRSWKDHTGGERAYGVEDRGHVGSRGADAMRSLVRADDTGRPGTLIVVGHGSWIVATIATLLGLSGTEVSSIGAMRNCHWSRMRPVHGGEGRLDWTLEEFNHGPATTEDWENGPGYLRVPGAPLWVPLDAVAGAA